MPNKTASAHYRKVDVQNFAHYITLAFFVGAIPNLVDDISPWLLAAAAVMAAAIAGLIWAYSKRKQGIGVFVHIPNKNHNNDPPTKLKYITTEMNKKHRDWFRSGPPKPADTVDERVEWSLKTIDYRLKETEQRDGPEAPLFLYIYLPLQESFTLGAKCWMSQEADGRQEFSTLWHYALVGRIKPRVRSLSKFTGQPDTYEIDLPATAEPRAEQRTTENPIECMYRDDLAGRPHEHCPAPHRMAIIIHAGPKNRESFVKEALQAAKGEEGHRYLTNKDDQCDHALVLGIRTDVLYNALNSSRPENPKPVLDKIRWTCVEEIKRTYNESDVPTRVFMLGPSILAFAMGALLPAGARLVTHDSRHTIPSGTRTDLREVVAIIDGDDVGTSAERFLLSGDLETASTYSRWVTKTLQEIVDDIDTIPGVKLHSAGGDSAIFVLSSDSLNALLRRLDELRSEFSFNISCGYGFGSFEAYNALRLAKTSGKNISTGSMHTAASETN